MNKLLAIAVLAAVTTVPCRAEDYQTLIAAEAELQARLKLARASAEQKADIFRFDDARLPSYLTAAIEKAAAAAAAKEKSVLRTQIASYENAIEAEFKTSGLGCQQRFDKAVADHDLFQGYAVADMRAIHSQQLQFRTALLAELAAGKSKPESTLGKIETDYQVMSTLRKRYSGSAVDQVVESAEKAGIDQISRDSRVEITRAKGLVAAEAAARSLSKDNFYRAEDLKLALKFGVAEPELKLCSGPYTSEREIPQRGSRSEKNVLYYHSCVTAGLLTGKLGGDTLASAFQEQDTAQVVKQDQAGYAAAQVSSCVSLEAARRAFAQKP